MSSPFLIRFEAQSRPSTHAPPGRKLLLWLKRYLVPHSVCVCSNVRPTARKELVESYTQSSLTVVLRLVLCGLSVVLFCPIRLYYPHGLRIRVTRYARHSLHFVPT